MNHLYLDTFARAPDGKLHIPVQGHGSLWRHQDIEYMVIAPSEEALTELFTEESWPISTPGLTPGLSSSTVAMSPEAYGKVTNALRLAEAERDSLKEQRDALAEALDTYMRKFGNCGQTYDDALAVLAKIKD